MCQNIVGHAKQSATDAFKAASKRAIQKTAEAAGDLIDNSSKITKAPKICKKIIQRQLQMRLIKKVLKERYISP